MRRLWGLSAFLLFLLPALACGSGNPTPQVAPSGAQPSSAPAASAAPASVGKVGETISLKTYSVALNAKQDPATGAFPAPSGKRWVAYDVTLTAIGDQVAYNPLYGKLKMADNTEVGGTVGGPSPALQSGTLAKGEAARGWLAFQIDAGAQPATLSYEILVVGNSGGKAQFDVR